MQSNNKQMNNGNCQQHPCAWNANGLNLGITSTMGQMLPVNFNPNQYPGMQPQNMVCVVPNGGMQMQGMGMQAKNFSAPHPVNCKCRTAQLPTFPPQPAGIPLMPLGGAEMYPIVNMNGMTPAAMNGQMCMFGSNYMPQSYIEPGMYVDPSQWKEICKHQNQQLKQSAQPPQDKSNGNK